MCLLMTRHWQAHRRRLVTPTWQSDSARGLEAGRRDQWLATGKLSDWAPASPTLRLRISESVAVGLLYY